jgi:hypothetical protein
MNPEPPTMIRNQGIYPFDLFFDPTQLDEYGFHREQIHFLVKWEMIDDELVPQIIVRFALRRYSSDLMCVHYTARSVEGHYQPWSAWDGCTQLGDSMEHARAIWHKVRALGNYQPVKASDPALREWKLTTRYKDQIWTPNADMFPKRWGVDEYISKIHSDYALDA